MNTSRLRRWIPLLLLAGVIPLLTACDEDNDRDFDPASGKGAIVVDNNTGRNIIVFIDGVRQGRVGDFSDRAFELDPGVYRIVLDEDGGDRNYRDDIDVLVNRLTILDVDVDNDFFDDDYDVEVFFD